MNMKRASVMGSALDLYAGSWKSLSEEYDGEAAASARDFREAPKNSANWSSCICCRVWYTAGGTVGVSEEHDEIVSARLRLKGGLYVEPLEYREICGTGARVLAIVQTGDETRYLPDGGQLEMGEAGNWLFSHDKAYKGSFWGANKRTGN